MLETFLKTNFVGKDGYFWWIGQIVEEKYWKQNIAPRPTTEDGGKDGKDFGGFDYRYKVRIMGYHTDDRDDLPDEELPWASIMYPVTAGAGSGGAHQSPNLRQGNFVYGFFMDGEDGQYPIITGVFGYNQYKQLERNEPSGSFVGFSGFNSAIDTVPYFGIPAYKPTTSSVSFSDTTKLDYAFTDGVISESSLLSDFLFDASSSTAYNQSKVKQPRAEDIGCDQERTETIQTILEEGVKKRQELLKAKDNWVTRQGVRVANLSNKLDDISGQLDAFDAAIQREMNDMQEKITGQMRTISDTIERGVNQSINAAMASAYSQVFPGALPDLLKETNKAKNDLSCAFRNIGANLFKMVGKFLSQSINKLINAPLCAINNMVGSLLGKVTGMIDGAVSAILGPVRTLIGSLGGATNLLDNIVSSASGALSFLSCAETPSCSEVKAWSESEGVVAPKITGTLDIGGIISQAKGIASGVKESIEQFKDIGSTIKGVVDGADFGNVVGDAIDSCFVGPLRCGPPTVEFFGGGGKGAAGNAIISAAGTLLGVDIILPGSGYTDVPFISFTDSCGKGDGASGTPVINDDGEVIDVIMEDCGAGYIPHYDGSQGGDGRTWADANQTTVKRFDNTYDPPYNPGTIITVCPGDEVTEPGGNTIVVDGEECSEITTKFPSEIAETAGTPPTVGTSPTLNTGEYPVILSLAFVNVIDMGINYDCSKDTVVVEPSNGAKLSIGKCDSLGSILKIDVLDGGMGFKEEPNIYIQSDSGYNVKLVPTFKVNRLDVDEDQVDGVTIPSTDIIQVIDCVGKF